MKNLYKKMLKAESQYHAAVGDLEAEISDKVDFDFFILYQGGDGFVMVHSDKSLNASLKPVLDIIEKKGVLTFDDYLPYTI